MRSELFWRLESLFWWCFENVISEQAMVWTNKYLQDSLAGRRIDDRTRKRMLGHSGTRAWGMREWINRRAFAVAVPLVASAHCPIALQIKYTRGRPGASACLDCGAASTAACPASEDDCQNASGQSTLDRSKPTPGFLGALLGAPSLHAPDNWRYWRSGVLSRAKSHSHCAQPSFHQPRRTTCYPGLIAFRGRMRAHPSGTWLCICIIRWEMGIHVIPHAFVVDDCITGACKKTPSDVPLFYSSHRFLTSTNTFSSNSETIFCLQY